MLGSIRNVDPRLASPAEIESAYRLLRTVSEEAWPEDGFLDLESFATQLRSAPAEDRRLWLQALDGGELAGLGSVGWRESPENRHIAGVEVSVAPAHRRRGLGRRLLAEAAAVAEAEGRALLMGATSSRAPAGEAFCRAAGAEVGLLEHENRLDLEEVDRGLLTGWQEPRPGYSLLAIDSPSPPELLAEICAVIEVINDAPRGDLQAEDEVWTPEYLAAIERAGATWGLRVWTVFARHEASGRLVGFSTIAWHPSIPQVVQQWGTGVQPEHRGHGLGRRLKAAMLERILRELPAARWIVTTNATTNRWMLAINRELGFRPAGTVTHWQVEAAKVRYTSRQPAHPLE